MLQAGQGQKAAAVLDLQLVQLRRKALQIQELTAMDQGRCELSHRSGVPKGRAAGSEERIGGCDQAGDEARLAQKLSLFLAVH